MNAAQATVPMFAEHNATRGAKRVDGAVFAGLTPAGSEWWTYPDRGQDHAALCKRVDALWAKHEGAKVRRVSLTPTQFELVEDIIVCREEGDSLKTVNLRKTFIEDTNDQLADIATFIDTDDHAMLAECGSMKAITSAEMTFLWRTAYASALMLKSKLEGNPITLTAARKAATHLRF